MKYKRNKSKNSDLKLDICAVSHGYLMLNKL